MSKSKTLQWIPIISHKSLQWIPLLQEDKK